MVMEDAAGFICAYQVVANGVLDQDVVVPIMTELKLEPEQFGLLFQKDNPLVTCVNQALSALTTNGTLAQLQTTWLKSYAAYPLIK